jgi:hypothetical protein
VNATKDVLVTQNVNPERVAIRSSGWLDGRGGFTLRVAQNRSGKDRLSPHEKE